MWIGSGAILLGLAAACGSTSTSSPASTSAPASSTTAVTVATTGSSSGAPACVPGGACVTLQVALSGDVSIAGTEKQPRNACSDLLAGDYLNGGKILSLPLPEGSISGHHLTITPSIYPWTGPATYGSHDVGLTSEDGFVTVDGVHYIGAAPDRPNPTLSATVKPDGSGSLTFSGLMLQSDHTRTLSGSLAWSCGPTP